MTMPDMQDDDPSASLPPGTRLYVAVVAEWLKVSITQMAAALRISRSDVYGATRQNFWPPRLDKRLVQAGMVEYLRSRGARPEDLARLFHAAPGRQAMGVRGGALTLQPESEPDVLLPKQTLTPQAAKHFKLFRNPFDGAVDRDEQFFCSDDIAYAREAVWQCARVGGFMALIGESGAGKTTIQADLEERLSKGARDVVVIKPSVLGMEETNRAGQMLKSADVLHAIISTLDASQAMPATLQARTVRAQKLLQASADAGNAHLLVLEEAHGMPDSTLKHMKRLHELRNGRRSLVGVLLLAQPELKVRLAAGLRSGTLREVAQRCEIVEMLPLDDALRGYLECRATAAGRALDALIEPAAVDQLRARLTRKTNTGTLSLSYPLAVNNMMTRALNFAAEIGAPLVSVDLVKAI